MEGTDADGDVTMNGDAPPAAATEALAESDRVAVIHHAGRGVLSGLNLRQRIDCSLAPSSDDQSWSSFPAFSTSDSLLPFRRLCSVPGHAVAVWRGWERVRYFLEVVQTVLSHGLPAAKAAEFLAKSHLPSSSRLQTLLCDALWVPGHAASLPLATRASVLGVRVMP